jgi:anti-sigma B factor antagonist
MFEIQFGTDGIVKLTGRLDASQAEHAQKALRGVEGSITADCSELDYVSSAGISVILELHKRVTGSGHDFRLTKMNPRVRTVFVYTGLDKVLKID